MIEINVNTVRFKVTVKGHALPEESEKYREICSAVSALVQGLEYTLTKFESDHDPFRTTEWRPTPGDTVFRVWPEEWAMRSVRKRIETYADGMELLALAHPGSVHMIRDGEEIKNFGGDENE